MEVRPPGNEGWVPQLMLEAGIPMPLLFDVYHDSLYEENEPEWSHARIRTRPHTFFFFPRFFPCLASHLFRGMCRVCLCVIECCVCVCVYIYIYI